MFGFPSTGAWGVDVFFVISGFIIGTVTVQNSAHFFRRRVFRVVPLYWVATFAWIAAMLVMPGRVNSTHVDAPGILKSLFFIPYQMPLREGPILQLGWTLNYEMFFYAVVAVLLIVFAGGARRALLTAAFVIGLLAISGFVLPSPVYLISFYQSSLLLEFVAGLGIAFAYRRISEGAEARGGGSRLRIPLYIVAGAFALLALVALVAHDLQFGPRYDIMRALVYGVPAVALVSASLVLEPLIRDGWLTRALLEVGDGSYATYLFHPFVLALVSHVLLAEVIANADAPMRLILLIATAGLAVLVGVAANRWFDAPLQRLLKRRFLRK